MNILKYILLLTLCFLIEGLIEHFGGPYLNVPYFTGEYFTEVNKLVLDMQAVPYSSYDYEENIFDCSNMANMLDDYLEAKGYDTKILIYPVDSKSSHAIVVVNDYIFVEPITKEIIKPPKDYTDTLVIQDAEMLLAYMPKEKWSKEWGYKKILYSY